MIVVDVRPHDANDKYGNCDIWINDALNIGTLFINEHQGWTADDGRGHRYWRGFPTWNEGLLHLLKESKQIVIKESAQ